VGKLLRLGADLWLPAARVTMSKLHCFRCKTVVLVETEHYPKIRFFQCPSCSRRYAKQTGRKLTYRWLEAVTLPLYRVIFFVKPVDHASDVARKFAAWYSREQLEGIVTEIRLELDEPTQRVRDTLDCKASEGELRQYLSIFCECVERILLERFS